MALPGIGKGSPPRSERDIIDDIMVRLDVIESQVSLISQETRYKGRIMNIYVYMDDIRDLLAELKKRVEKGQG